MCQGLLLLLLLLSAPLEAGSSIRVFALGDRRGEVAPCGCPRIQLGGIQRLAVLLDEKNAQGDAFVIDTGNSFYALPQLPETREKQEQKKAELIADAYRILKADVLVPGPRDLAKGVDGLKALAERAGVHLVATNLLAKNGQPLFEPYHVLERKGVRLGIVAAVGTELAFPAGRVDGNVDSLKKAITKLRSEGVQAVALVVQSQAQLESLRGLDVNLVVVPPQEEGKAVGEMTWDGQAKWQEHELVPAYQRKSRIDSLYEKHLADVRELAVDKSTSFTVRPKGAYVAQYGVCKQCHLKQVEFWKGTKHASAYLVLFSKNQHFNPECIGCHSLGFGEEKGFTDITAPIQRVGTPERKPGETPFVETWMKEVFSEDTAKKPLDSRTEPDRYAALKKKYHASIQQWQSKGELDSLHMGVQCEHCHGNRSGHPSPTFKKFGKVKKASCVECHVAPFDPTFNFKKRLPSVACPLGAPKRPAAPRLSK